MPSLCTVEKRFLLRRRKSVSRVLALAFLLLAVAAYSLAACEEAPSSSATEAAKQTQPSPVTATAPSTKGAPTTTPPGSVEPVVAKELAVVGRLNVAQAPGHITDIWSLGNYAYLGSSDLPGCSTEFTGVYIIDISDPSRPTRAGFIPSPPGARIGDVNVASIATPFFAGDVLVHAIEPCGRSGAPGQAPLPDTDGISIFDVTDPLKPRLLRQSFLEVPVHNAFVIQAKGKALALVVSDGRFEGIADKDFYIVDISDPASPAVLSLTGAPDWGVAGEVLGTARIAGLHDVWAQTYSASLPNSAYAGKTIAYLSYWDAGLVILDITDPANPVFLGDSDYLDPDPLSGRPPEGNSHSAVPSEDGSLVFMSDEDFTPEHIELKVGSGAFPAGFRSVELPFTRPIARMPGSQVSGPATFLGLAGDASSIPAPGGSLAPGEVFIAIIERGEINIDQKIANAARAGYGAAVVFNSAADPERLGRISGDQAFGTIPSVLATRAAGFALLGIDPSSPPDTFLPPAGSPAAPVVIESVFDGWGYARVLDVRDPRNIVELGQYATGNALSREIASGDHSAHNLVVQGGRAYIAWYADGIRVVDFADPRNPKEIARFVDVARGSNFWGVHLHKHPDGRIHVLGSDRDTGLWIFDLP